LVTPVTNSRVSYNKNPLPRSYLNFSTQRMKNVSSEHKKIKLLNKWHFVGKTTDYAACLKNAVNTPVTYIYKMKF